MKKEQFVNLYEEYESTSSAKEKEYTNQLENWKKWVEVILKDFKIEKWIKQENESKEYLPYFLDVGEKKFGHARIANYDQIMIYKYTGKDEKRNGKFIDSYKEKNKQYDKIDDIKKDFEDNIRILFQDMVKAKDLNEIFDLEKNSKYKEFSCKLILRKVSVLMSVMKDSKYRNAFPWIYTDKAINILYDLLFENNNDDDLEETFFQKSNKVYKTVKEWLDFDKEEKSYEEWAKLNEFLWYLTDSNSTVFTDFNNVNIIFSGAPGTGKTYTVNNSIQLLKAIDPEHIKDDQFIQFHPSFTYQDFIEGIKPVGIENGNLNLQVLNGSFKQFCIDVKKKNEEYYKNLKNKPNEKSTSSDFKDWPHYYYVVDEINRGNLANIFGEVFSLLENRDYNFSGNYVDNKNLITTPLSNVIKNLKDEEKGNLVYKEIKGKIWFGIPFNIHFIGMMNDVDRSIDPFDLALRRRFKWIATECDYDVISEQLIKNGFINGDVDEYVKSCEALNKFICETGLKLGKAYQIGHSFFLKMKDLRKSKNMDSKKKELFDNYILGTLKEYIRQVVDETEIDKYVEEARKAFGIK